MIDPRIRALVEDVVANRYDRRAIVKRAVGLGMSTSMIAAVLAAMSGNHRQTAAQTSASSLVASPGASESATPSASPAASPAAGLATDFPEEGKALTFIVPWGAGGGSDIGARALASKLEAELGTTVAVVNLPGGGSLVGLTEFVQAPPDGYTIAMTNLPSTIGLYSNPELEATWTPEDLKPVALHVLDPAAIAVAADSPYQSLTDLMNAASASPGAVTLSSSGPLSVSHLSILLLQQLTGVTFATVFFDDAGQQRASTLGGHVAGEVGTLGELVPAVRSGELRVIAVFGAERSEFLPEAPTALEQGFDVQFASARGISAPAGTPPEIVNALAQAIQRAMENPEHQAEMRELGLPLRFMGPEEFSKYWDDAEAVTVPLIEGFLESS